MGWIDYVQAIIPKDVQGPMYYKGKVIPDEWLHDFHTKYPEAPVGPGGSDNQTLFKYLDDRRSKDMLAKSIEIVPGFFLSRGATKAEIEYVPMTMVYAIYLEIRGTMYKMDVPQEYMYEHLYLTPEGGLKNAVNQTLKRMRVVVGSPVMLVGGPNHGDILHKVGIDPVRLTQMTEGMPMGDFMEASKAVKHQSAHVETYPQESIICEGIEMVFGLHESVPTDKFFDMAMDTMKESNADLNYDYFYLLKKVLSV